MALALAIIGGILELAAALLCAEAPPFRNAESPTGSAAIALGIVGFLVLCASTTPVPGITT